jgi:hypothetical protein
MSTFNESDHRRHQDGKFAEKPNTAPVGGLALQQEESFAHTRREQYRVDAEAAQQYFRDTQDLVGFQERNRAARDTWHQEVREHYRDPSVEAALNEALMQDDRVYVELVSGERVRVQNVGNLYDVSDTTGAPAEPLIARMRGDFIGSNTTIADLISRA